MATELRVLVTHLGELAAKHGEAAAAIHSATEATSGLDGAVRTSHGAISAATAAAVGSAARARRAAGAQLELVSQNLHDRLRESAASYTATDEAVGGAIIGVIPTGGAS